MKILTIGDLHDDLSQAKKLALIAEKEKVDLVVFNGDFTLGGIHTPGLLQVFKEKGLKLALLPGNHESLDVIDFLKYKYAALDLQGYGVKLGDVGIFGCGSANIGIFQMPEDEIYSELKKGFNRIKDAKKKIMITHMHPDETLITRVSGFSGSKGVRWALESFQPDFLLSAHMHETEGLEENFGPTKIISVGKAGKIIEL